MNKCLRLNKKVLFALLSTSGREVFELEMVSYMDMGLDKCGLTLSGGFDESYNHNNISALPVVLV